MQYKYTQTWMGLKDTIPGKENNLKGSMWHDSVEKKKYGEQISRCQVVGMGGRCDKKDVWGWCNYSESLSRWWLHKSLHVLKFWNCIPPKKWLSQHDNLRNKNSESHKLECYGSFRLYLESKRLVFWGPSKYLDKNHTPCCLCCIKSAPSRTKWFWHIPGFACIVLDLRAFPLLGIVMQYCLLIIYVTHWWL